MRSKRKIRSFYYLITMMIISISVSGCILIPGIKYSPATLSDGYILDYYNVKAKETLTLPSIYNGEPVTEIGGNVLGPQTISIKVLVIPDSVIRIHLYAFEFSRFEECHVGNSVEEIRNNAFSNSGYLSKIYLPDSVNYIGKDVFRNCEKLTIYCSPGSYAEEYAIENDIPYVIHNFSDSE